MQITCVALSAGPHVIEVNELLLSPEDGLLLGNGDLSVSVYQTADRIVWRFGKNDVWDRRHDLSDAPEPAHIDEIARGSKEEGWRSYPYHLPPEKVPGSNGRLSFGARPGGKYRVLRVERQTSAPKNSRKSICPQ